MYLLVDE